MTQVNYDDIVEAIKQAKKEGWLIIKYEKRDDREKVQFD